MRIFLLSVMCCFLFFSLMAQDSIVVYHTASREISMNNDSADNYTVFTSQGKQWFGRTYFAKTKTLESQGSYTDSDINKRMGSFDTYNDSGVLVATYVFDKNSELRSMTQYYESGKKISYIEWKKNGKVEETGWDEQGNIIPGFIVQQEAKFPGGARAWMKYLQNNLKHFDLPKNNIRPGTYRVMVSFRVDSNGKITEVKAEHIPPGCVPCAIEAARVIQEGPDWQPAIYNNKKVIYRQRQTVTFVFEDESRRRD